MVMIGIDPHKRTHTAVAIDRSERVLGERLVRATDNQVPELLEWAKRLDGSERLWAIESAGGLGYLLAQQLLAAGEQVVDIPATLASRVRLLGSGRSEKNDPNDARSVAIAALRASELVPVRVEDHATVLRLLSRRHAELGWAYSKTACRFHALMADGTVALADDAGGGEAAGMHRRRPSSHCVSVSSAFVGFRFPPEVILLAVRWYLRYGLSYRDVEELLAERGIEVDHVTLFRWVQRFTPLLVDAARPCRHRGGGRWFVDETYVKVAGRWRYVYRAVDQHGQVIDVYASSRRDTAAATRFFTTAISAHGEPSEVTTDRAWTLARALDEVLPGARHDTTQYANNRVETDHGRLKARLRPMRGLKRDRTARVIITGHAFIQNLRRGHYELGLHARTPPLQLAAAFDELAHAI